MANIVKYNSTMYLFDKRNSLPLHRQPVCKGRNGQAQADALCRGVTALLSLLCAEAVQQEQQIALQQRCHQRHKRQEPRPSDPGRRGPPSWPREIVVGPSDGVSDGRVSSHGERHRGRRLHEKPGPREKAECHRKQSESVIHPRGESD